MGLTVVSLYTATPLGPPVSLVSSIYSRTPNVVKKSLTWTRKQLPNLDPKDLLPIGVEVYKAAIVCGNNGTPSLLVAEFEQADGTYSIVPVRIFFRFVLNIII